MFKNYSKQAQDDFLEMCEENHHEKLTLEQVRKEIEDSSGWDEEDIERCLESVKDHWCPNCDYYEDCKSCGLTHLMADSYEIVKSPKKTMKDIKAKYPTMIFTAQEWIYLKEIKDLIKRIIDLEKEVENLKNQLN